MRKITIMLALVAISFWAMPFSTLAGNVAAVQEFVAAFNAQDVERMLAVAHEDIEWLYVDGGSIQQETAGKEALRKSMTDYFASCPSCRSVIEVGNVQGDYVSVVETASWESAGVTRSQSSLAVYQLQDGYIRRVWYFPVSR